MVLMPKRFVAASRPQWAVGFDIARDFRRGMSWGANNPLTTTHAQSIYADNVSGGYQAFAAGVPVITDKGAQTVPTRTNLIKNPSAAGATDGVIGSGGVLPTGWSTGSSSFSSVTRTVTQMTRNGLSGIAIRYQIVATAGAQVLFDRFGSTADVALAGSTAYWISFFSEVIAGSVTGVSMYANITQFDAASALTADTYGTTVPVPTGWSRYGLGWTTAASTTKAEARFRFTTDAAGTYDFTVFLAWPQIETGSFATPPIADASATTTDTINGDQTIIDLTGKLASGVRFIWSGVIRQPSVSGASNRVFEINDGTADNRVSLIHSSGNLYLDMVAGGVSQASLNLGPWASGLQTIVGVAGTDYVMGQRIGGTAPSADTSATYPTGMSKAALGGVGYDATGNTYETASLLAIGFGPQNASTFADALIKAERVYAEPFSPSMLFASSEVGAWYDPSDLTTLFQDSAGTTPVTAAGDPVGLMRDKSGRGNHATGSSTTRPTYAIAPKTGRRNLLTYTEQFDNAAWVKDRVTVSANAIVAPDGSITADKVIDTAVTSNSFRIYNSITLSSIGYTQTFYAKAAELSWCYIRIGNALRAFFNLATGVIGSVDTGMTASIQSVGNGWYRITATIATATAGAGFGLIGLSTGNNVEVYTSTGGNGIYVWGAQLETGSTATAYQKVVSQYEVTEAGVPSLSCLNFDGVDDFMLTGTITPGTDKVQVFAGVRKLSDATSAKIVAELSATIASNNGAFRLAAPDSAAANYGFSSKGTTQTDAVGTTYTAPISNVLTGLGDISGDVTTLRVNGVQVAQATTDQGTGNYLAYPLYIGRRGGASLPYNGNLYGLIVRFGPNLTDAVIRQAENWLNQRTGAY